MTYRFDDVEIDAEGFRVTKAGEPVRLEPKALELLLFLARNPGRLVTKAEIQESVWKDTAVTENALTRLVAQIRKGLGDDAREARYIETVPTKGYRFVATLARGAESPARTRGGDRPAPPRRGAGGARPPGGGRGAALLALILVGLALGWTGRRPVAATPAAAPPRPLEQQVSTGATLNVFPRFSPDGSSLAFATLRNGSLEIVLRALALGARETAVTSDGMQNVQPAPSPDGRLIAYHSVGRGGIWLVPALGGVPRRLTAFGSSPAWSPDGSLVAFQSQAWAGSAEAFGAAGEGSTIWLVPAKGGEPRRLTSIAEVGPGGQGGPAWSPDGRLVSFVAGTRVFTVGRDGGGLRETSHGLRAHGVAWEKSGRSQVWTGFQAGNWCAWRVPVAPATGEAAGEPQVLASGGESASAWSHLALSPDGRAIAYVTFRTRYEILSQGVAADGRASGEATPLVTSARRPEGPARLLARRAPPRVHDAAPGCRALPVDGRPRLGEARLVAEEPGLLQ